MIVPIALVQQEDVPIRNQETGTSYFEPRAEHDSKSTYPHYRINRYHPWQRQRFHTVNQREMTLHRISPFYIDITQSSFFHHVQHHA